MRIFTAMLFVSALFTLFATTATAGEKSIDDYWEDVSLRFSSFASEIGPECEKNFVEFYSCVEGLSGALSRAEPKLTLSTRELVDEDDIFVDLGSVVIAETPKFNIPDSQVVAKHKAEKRLRANRINSFKKLYSKKSKVPFKKVLAFITENMIDGNTDAESVITAEAINAKLSASNDPHTYITPTEYFFERDGSHELFGIGVKIKIEDGSVLITNPIEGSPAHKAGIRAKDVITHVNGKLLSKKSARDDVNRISGPRGTKVKLSIKRGKKSIEFKIVREKIEFKNITYKTVTDTGRSVGYIKINSFLSKSVCTQVKLAIENLDKTEGLVMDLRGNVGGYLSEGTCVADLFLAKGKTILTQKNLDGSPSTVFASKSNPVTNKPLTVLVDAESASASEIVAGALQDHGRSITVGVRSFGKGSVQKPDYWVEKDGVIFAKTVARFYLPSGRTNQIHGIAPDLTAYNTPTPSEDDKFFVREADQYSNPLAAIGKPWKETDKKRIAKIQKIKGCVEKTTQPKKLFNKKQNETFAPDYQLIYAEGVTSCSS